MESQNEIKKNVMIALGCGFIVACMLGFVFKYNESRVVIYDIAPLIQSLNYKYSVDNVSFENGILTIEGWVLKPGEDISIAELYVVLEDIKQKVYYQIPTQIVYRSDVTNSINDGHNYDMCGFLSKVKEGQHIDMNNEYRVYVMYRSNGEKDLVDLNTLLEEEISHAKNK